MELRESDKMLGPICRSVEILTRGVSDLQDLILPIELLPTFENEPEAQRSNSIRNSPAAYRRSERKILVNQNRFLGLKEEIAKIILIHEAGHAYYHRNEQDFCNYPGIRELFEDEVVDLLLCRWGFEEQLIEERKDSYGDEYCKALQLWRDETEYVKAMIRCRLKKLSGILKGK